MTTREIQEAIASNMDRWMKVEDASVASTGKIIEKTRNPIVRLIMEIIQRDSLMHHRVQEFIKDSLEKGTISISPDELADVWDMVENHIQIEERTIEAATDALEAIKGKKMVVQEYLLHYLLTDEKKHTELLKSLSTIKRGMYPYG